MVARAAMEERARLVKAFNLDGRVNVRAPLGMPVLNEILRTLYAAPSIVTVLPIQDLFGWCARINVPGTVSDSNWTYRLPIPLERMTTSHAIQSRAHDLKEIASATVAPKESATLDFLVGALREAPATMLRPRERIALQQRCGSFANDPTGIRTIVRQTWRCRKANIDFSPSRHAESSFICMNACGISSIR